MLVPSAFSQSMAAFVAQNYGAGKMDRAHKGLLYGICISMIIGLVMAWCSFFHGDILCRLFATDEEVIMNGWQYLNGCGDTKFVMIQNLFGALCIRVPVSYMMSKIRPVSLFRIGLATPCSSLTQCILCLGYLFLVAKRREKNTVSK